jgi:hypothetical protein
MGARTIRGAFTMCKHKNICTRPLHITTPSGSLDEERPLPGEPEGIIRNTRVKAGVFNLALQIPHLFALYHK